MLKRKLFLKSECKNKLLKSIKRSKNTPFYTRYKSSYFLTKTPRIASQTQLRNRCIISGRVHFVNTKTKLTRFTLREKAYAAQLPGLSRAS
mgnify:CR=1 FL=1